MTTIIETFKGDVYGIGSDSIGFRAVTIAGKNGINYAVEKFISNEWVCLWETTILFRQIKSHRPGGYAFQRAAREQEVRLKEFIDRAELEKESKNEI